MESKKDFSKSLYDLFFDICIIGGGASGMSAAISAMETNPALRVCIIEKKQELGKKLLATGNGKCNITNKFCNDFEFVEKFLNHTGIILREDCEGRMYPNSEQSLAVVELLKRRIKTLNIATFTSCNVLDISKDKKDKEELFNITIDCEKEKVSVPCKKVIIACGGKAGPQFGTTGDGYTMAKNFGHSIKKVYPVLMPIECEEIKKELKGVRAKAKVCLLKNEQIIAEEQGEIQFTEEGLSGICIFNLTRFINLQEHMDIPLHEAFKKYSIEIDFLPWMEECEVIEFLKERRFDLASLKPEFFLASVVNMKLAKVIVESVVGSDIASIGNIDYESVEEIAMLLKSSRYIITGAKGWKDAQCTGGGIPLEETNLQNMESNIQRGLYFAGEVLDFDGPCGGYNLHHAWTTGLKAGKGAALSLTKNMVIGE
ncbi:MAG: aminoacetone oxidase family FAD-binding enzyme [Aminipila sp.]